MRRESYSNRFATALEGVDIDNPGTALDRSGHPNPVPRVVGPIRRRNPVQVRDVEFLRGHTTKPIKITVQKLVRCTPKNCRSRPRSATHP